MKKTLSILSSLIYFTLTIGISFNVHYCKGEVKSISVFEKDTDCCCNDENAIMCSMKNNCCNDEEYLFQFYSDNQLASINSFSFDQYKLILNEKLVNIEPILEDIDLITSNNSDFPPPKIEHRYIQNCSLLFYA